MRALRIPSGTSGDFDNLPGMLKSFDPETGDEQWSFYSTLPREAPDAFSGGATGGNMWITGTYDPQLNLVYVGTGNPTPVLAAQNRPGDNPWTCSIVAINPDTRSEEHTSELQSPDHLVCRLLLEKK